ncbi:hypothetical protein EYZ11_003337 [Aspergillus tanneri]|uniref:Uncharacterized protein n=1 Tax=Aspergillus tanneri TaxID=1220188 RepID=A0A4S3JNK8_9EURO|nr:hypothetical protein EYZ11_003337 [Aspergillus tanneri]
MKGFPSRAGLMSKPIWIQDQSLGVYLNHLQQDRWYTDKSARQENSPGYDLLLVNPADDPDGHRLPASTEPSRVLAICKCPPSASPASHQAVDAPVGDEHRHDHLRHDNLSPDRHPSAAVVSGDSGVFDALSRALYDSLPSRQDTASNCKASGHHSIPFHEILTTPYILDRDSLRSQNRLLEIPGPNVHPVLIARHMLHLASFLQHLHADLHEEIRGLSEPPQIMRDRLA